MAEGCAFSKAKREGYQMYIPLQYQVSEYDCVPTCFINAVSYLFERNEIPPMVIRHIYMYSLDTVGRHARLGSAGTSKHAIRLLGSWLNSYKFRKFSVSTEFIEGEEVNFGKTNQIYTCLQEGGVALCRIFLAGREEHYLLLIKVEEDWVFCFDPYFRKTIRGLSNRVFRLERNDIRSPNLKIHIEWIEKKNESVRFCLGPIQTRESLLIFRD
jgi:hypothetical protein